MFETRQLKRKYDDIAPDKSEIRPLLGNRRCNMWHCTLPPRRTSKAVCHKSVDEIWFFISGHGSVWRSNGNVAKTVSVKEGTCLTIPTGTKFQFQNKGSANLVFIGVTTPPWPGKQEAYEVNGRWDLM